VFITIIIFIIALAVLLTAANFFTRSAEVIGQWLKFPPFVIGIFIVGIGTSLPELVSGIISVNAGSSEIVPGNIVGANISNLLLVTGFAIAINRKSINLGSAYIAIDLHFLIGSFFAFYLIAYDGQIDFIEASVGMIIFIVYSIYLIKSGAVADPLGGAKPKAKFPVKSFIILLIAAVGIYFGADYTVSSIGAIAESMSIPKSIIALTLLSLGTTLPELVVNVSAIRKGKAEMAIGNVLGSCIFNTLVIPGAAAAFGKITVPSNLLTFSLPVMTGCGILFYLLTQDKKISVWEGILFICLYVLFLIKIAF
jgi:cation:H+ antiporter